MRFVRAIASLALAVVFAAAPAAAQEVVTEKALSLDMAHAIAQGAVEKCRADGYHVRLTDAFGLKNVKQENREIQIISEPLPQVVLLPERISPSDNLALTGLNDPRTLDDLSIAGFPVPLGGVCIANREQGTLDPDTTLVEKPFTRAELLATIRHQLDRTGTTFPPPP